MAFWTNINKSQDIKLSQDAANHDFTVSKHFIKTESGVPITDHVAILTNETDKYLGTVGSGWEPIQPDALYDLAGELVQSTNGTINGAFTMAKGAVIGISLNLAERQYIANDIIELNFIMITAFNGTHGIAGHSTTKRLVNDSRCNTSSKIYNLKHTKNVHNRLEVVKNILKYYNNEITSFDEKMASMVKSRMNDNAAVEWFKSLFPKPNSERAQNILNNQADIFIDCLNNGKGSKLIGVRGTCYGAFQALTEYINHYRTTRVHNERDLDEVKFQSIHFGSGNALAQKGLANITRNFIEFSEEDFLID